MLWDGDLDRVGFEHPSLTALKTPISGNPRTESGTVRGQNGTSDHDLAIIQERWPVLPDPIKAAIVALVKSVHTDTAEMGATV